MRKILTIVVAFCLFFTVSVSSDFRKSGPDTALKETLKSAFFGNDTIRIIHWTFNYGMPNDVTEVEGVDIVVHPTSGVVTDSVLEITVSGGGSDYIQQTTTGVKEAWCRLDVRVASGYSGWDSYEKLMLVRLGTGASNYIYFAVKDVSGTKKWYIIYDKDVSFIQADLSSISLDDTWFEVFVYFKISSADGADNGEIRVWVDSDSVYAATGIDNDTKDFNNAALGSIASSDIDAAEINIDNVLYYTPEGLP